MGLGLPHPRTYFHDESTGKQYLLWKIDGNAHGVPSVIKMRVLPEIHDLIIMVVGVRIRAAAEVLSGVSKAPEPPTTLHPMHPCLH